ncbi:hypothetical protein [Actinoplanes subtropicus]|uniref:hypothetical protein n=1 Tax=Actinoplanes subtropicus TaxID=543632 RepID=UPI0004C38262|nr:hypothetical protein [Actinoplanes subtropicus]
MSLDLVCLYENKASGDDSAAVREGPVVGVGVGGCVDVGDAVPGGQVGQVCVVVQAAEGMRSTPTAPSQDLALSQQCHLMTIK